MIRHVHVKPSNSHLGSWQMFMPVVRKTETPVISRFVELCTYRVCVSFIEINFADHIVHVSTEYRYIKLVLFS